MDTTKSILTHSNGNHREMQAQTDNMTDEFAEIGSSGIEAFSGYIMKAYNAKLFWPQVEPIYTRIWRSDPESTVVRTLFTALTGQQRLTWELPQNIGGVELDEPTDDDLRQLDFAHTLTADVQGGLHKWLSECNGRTSFYGFGAWEMPLGLRREGWTAEDGWQSKFNDNLVGIRKIAFRDYSSFMRWEMDDHTGDVEGFVQIDSPNPERMIPIENLLHITYGDSTNPEGLATMEALWRLERVLYQYQLIHGIGAEHAAGYVKFTVKEELGDSEQEVVRKAARAILTAQEGNYITEIEEKFTADIIDTPFQAAEAVLNAIRYYSILKLSIYGMQFVGMNTMTNVGSHAALKDSSSMALLIFNSMTEGFVNQASEQIERRIFDHPTNQAAFPNATRRPVLKVSKIEKVHELPELAQFVQAISTVFPLGEEDQIAIRRKSGVLPETIPEEETAVFQPNDNADMSVIDWWQLRQEIYGRPDNDHIELIARLDDATTDAELSAIREELGNG